MSRCPNCSEEFRFDLRNAFLGPHVGPSTLFAFRCGKCGIKLGYPGWRGLIATVVGLLPLVFGGLALYFSVPHPLPPNLPGWLVVAFIVLAAGSIFLLAVVGEALPAAFLSAKVLPKEYQ